MQKLILIRTKEGVRELCQYLEDKTVMSVDTETTGLKVDSEIIGISICAEDDIGYYIVTAEWDVGGQALRYLDTKDEIPNLLKLLTSKKLIFHNGVYDCAMILNNYGISLIEALHTDTMILAHLLDENRRVGLKELGAAAYGDSAKKEQEEMKASVLANGGQLTKECYELYKADSELMGKYGAKDAILTWNLFYEMVPQLFEEKLDAFFYEDESMPMLRGPTFHLNTSGLNVDLDKLASLKSGLEIKILELHAFIYKEIDAHIKEAFPGTTKKNQFNVNSNNQLAWLLFEKLGNVFPKLSQEGRHLCHALELQVPYSGPAKRDFIQTVKSSKGFQWRDPGVVWDKKTRRYKGKAKVKDYWTYISTDMMVLQSLAQKYTWVAKLLDFKRLNKLLYTYVEGIATGIQYGVIRPSFLQHGTTSGRYSSRNPNFQNLPRDDKRVKSCIVARKGNVFVGADYSQLEPRVFASFSGDKRLLNCFKDGDDFYSVVGTEVFDKKGLSLKKNDKEGFAAKHPQLRDVSKVVALSSVYGTTAAKMAPTVGKSMEECQYIIDNYFNKFPQVKILMETAHHEARTKGVVYSLFGRPRRMPQALEIDKSYKGLEHAQLPYEARNLLNLAINHTIQSTGASIMNRASIAVYRAIQELIGQDTRWSKVRIVLQVHDELVLEGPEALGPDMAYLLKSCMEKTTQLPGVELIAEPKIAYNLADLK